MSDFKIFTDGASRGNPGPASIGVVVYDSEGQEIHQIARKLGIKTNNQAEYQAVYEALAYMKSIGEKSFLLYSDSQLLVRQLKGIYKVKNVGLREIYGQIKSLENHFEKFDYIHVPREENKRADELANLALDQ